MGKWLEAAAPPSTRLRSPRLRSGQALRPAKH